ncbi:MAG: CAP domain-containing protein [bacterium]|nr:CAP domain-containing protein [Candidatus Wildermuthbacteria bacterium]MDP2664902.1 CAP domain-containing protein [bacterium]
MKKWFSKNFVPSKENEYKPYILRVRSLLSIILVGALLEFLFLAYSLYLFPKTSFLASLFPGALIELTNEERKEAEAPLLKVNTQLQEGAQLKAEDMARNHYFAHIAPSGKTPWDWFKVAQYSFSYAGENLALNYFDSGELVESWMESESHKSNILNKNFTETGIGIAKGTQNGVELIYVVQFFGKPTLSAPASPVTPKKEEIVAQEDTTVSQEAQIKAFSLSTQAITLITQPKKVSVGAFGFLGGFIGIALSFNVAIKIRKQYLSLIVPTLLILLLLGAAIWWNEKLELPGNTILELSF